MRLNRRHVMLQSLGLLLAGCANSLGFGKPAAGHSSLNFLALGDWGMDGEHFQRDVANAMGEAGTRLDSQFVIAVGDNFYDAGVASVSDPHWSKSFEDVYAAASLQTPWYAVLGNHDYGGSPQAQIDYARTSHRWRMPARYYTRSMKTPDGASVDMFFIDTSPFVGDYHARDKDSLFVKNVVSQDTAAQLKWFEAELAKSKADWKLVFGHHPVFSGGVHGDTKELAADVEPLLRRYGVQAFIAGHDHDLQHIQRDGITYIGTGAAATTRRVKAIEGTAFCSDLPGFTAYQLTADKLVIDFIGRDGAVLHTADVPRIRRLA